MARVAFVHWKEAELPERLARLRKAGHTVKGYFEEGGGAARAIQAQLPNVVVIDLERLPSHGRSMGSYLRERKGTRHLPLVFVGGLPEKVEQTKKVLPDAEFVPWSRIRGAITRAAKRKSADPVVPPGAMAGYSGTPLPKKLGIRAGERARLIGAPKDFEQTLGSLPDGARLTRRAGKTPANVVLLFCKELATLEKQFVAATRQVSKDGSFWICWPKQASGMKTDLTGNVVRKYGLDRKWVDYKIAAIDATWSGLRFAKRKPGARKK